EPAPLGEAPALTGPVGERAVSVSNNGILAHPESGLPNTQLVWYDRTGKPNGTIPLPPGRYEGLSVSPDDQRLLVERRSPATALDLWMVEISRAVATRFTFSAALLTGNEVWSPDANWVAYNSSRSGPAVIFRKRASGAGEEEPLLQSNALFKNVQQ